MSDNRQRPRIHRCDDKHDALIRAYARTHGIEPWQALETAIGRLKDPDGPAIDRLTEERDALRAELASARAAHKIVAERGPEIRSAPALPRDLEKRVKACIAARPHARPPRDFAFVVKNGCDRIEASDRYQDAQKAAKRAEEA